MTFLGMGTGDWTQRHSTSELHPQPYFIFLLKQGLTRLVRVSILAEAVLEAVILLSLPPKYWDYRHAPPHPDPYHVFIRFVCVCVWYWGLDPEAFYL